MRRIVLCLSVFCACAFSTVAQTVTTLSELNAQRVAETVLTPQQVKAEKKLMKEARKAAKARAKAMKAEGWKPAAGTASLEEQLTERLAREMRKNGNLPAYYLEATTVNGGSYGVARKQVIARCRAALVQNMGMEIAGLIKDSDKNIELSNGQHETLAQFIDDFQEHYEKRLGRTEVVVDAVREKENGGVEVHVCISYSSQECVHTFLNMVKEQDPEIAEKLESVFW